MYKDEFDAGLQVDLEEMIASIIFETVQDAEPEEDDTHMWVSEQMAGDLGRMILARVVKNLRPDLWVQAHRYYGILRVPEDAQPYEGYVLEWEEGDLDTPRKWDTPSGPIVAYGWVEYAYPLPYHILDGWLEPADPVERGWYHLWLLAEKSVKSARDYYHHYAELLKGKSLEEAKAQVHPFEHEWLGWVLMIMNKECAA